MEIRIRGKEVRNFPSKQISTIHEVTDAILGLNSHSVCQGIPNYGTVSSIKDGIKLGNVWFSEKCDGTFSEDKLVCSGCTLLKNRLKVSLSRTKMQTTYKSQHTKTPRNPSSALARSKRLRNLLSATKIRLGQNQRRASCLSIHLKLMRKKFKSLDQTKIHELLKKADVPDKIKLAMTEALKIAKVKSSTGIRQV